MAELLSQRVASFEQVQFCVSETDAVALALQAARAMTNRPVIAKFEGVAHGSNEYARLSAAPTREQWQQEPATVAAVPGTPEPLLSSVLTLPLNDFSACRALLGEQAQQVAGILLDPAPACCGLQPLDGSFLAGLHVLVKELGILLIYDERRAFRLGYGGARGRYAGEPDLTVLGQVLGGGYPLGALAGPRERMQTLAQLARSIERFAASPVSLAAAQASLTLLTRDSFRKLDQVGERVRAALNEQIQSASAALQVTGSGSMLMLHPHTRPVVDYRSFYRDAQEQHTMVQLRQALMRSGVLIAEDGALYLSTALSIADEMRLEDAFADSLKALD